MMEREKTDYEDSERWDLDNPVKAGPIKNRRTVVSVSFPSGAFQVVVAAAGEAGLSTSQFIREAAIAKASPGYVEGTISWAGGTPSVVAHLHPSCTTWAQTTFEPRIDRTEGANVFTPA